MVSSETRSQKAFPLPFPFLGYRKSFSFSNFKFWDFYGISCLLSHPSVCSTAVLLLTIYSLTLPHTEQIFLRQAWAGGPQWAKPYFSPTAPNLSLLLLNPPTLILWYITHLQLFEVLTMVFSLNCLSSSLHQANIRICWERLPWSGDDYKLCQWEAKKQLGFPEDQIEHDGPKGLHVPSAPQVMICNILFPNRSVLGTFIPVLDPKFPCCASQMLAQTLTWRKACAHILQWVEDLDLCPKWGRDTIYIGTCCFQCH